MEEFVAYLVKNLVSSPSDVAVTSREDNGILRLAIKVAQEDVGKVIGRRGNTISALRILARIVAMRAIGKIVHLELVQAEAEVPAREEESMALEQETADIL